MLSCPLCESKKYKTALMGSSVVTGYVCLDKEESLRQPIFEVQLNLCANCSTLFQTKYQSAEAILNKMYTQHEATIRSSEHYSAYYEHFANNVAKNISPVDSSVNIMEIGCNDGLLLGLIGSKCKATIYGVEPSVKFGGKWKERQIIGINDFFGAEIAGRMKQEFGAMNTVIARHVLEHIANPHDFFGGLKVISDKNTTIFIEVPYLTSVFQLGRFENVSYSHLVHYSVKSMTTLAAQYGFLVSDCNLCDVDGGSIVFKLRRLDAENVTSVELPKIEECMDVLFDKFIFEFGESKAGLHAYINQKKGETFIGFGAGAKGQSLIHLYGLQELFTAVIDETPGYPSKFIPGTSIPIVGLDYLDKFESAVLVNLAPTHTEAVRRKIPSRFSFVDPVNKLY
ncbi:MAG: hypothetical protein RLZZ601_109 [Pseudomonadota bacterium]|jgi:hypothetical protein